MPSAPPPLPDFVGIGALKAGTTYLDQLLRTHPALVLPQHLKETEYFTRHFDRGPQWYAGLFDPSAEGLRGEVSPQYVSDPDAPARIQAANPDVRILVSLRQPVKRLVSQYRHFAQQTGYDGDLDRFLVDHPGSVERSRYAEQLAPWLDRFGRDRVSVIVFEDLVSRPQETVGEVYRFLGVDPTLLPEGDQLEAANTSFTPRFPKVYAAGQRASRALYDHGGARLVQAVKRSGVLGAMRSSSGGSEREEAPLPRATLDRLTAELREDAVRLEPMIGRDLAAEWFEDGADGHPKTAGSHLH